MGQVSVCAMLRTGHSVASVRNEWGEDPLCARFRGGGGLDLTQEAELRARDLAQVREQLTRELAEDERLGLHSARAEPSAKPNV